MATHGIGIESSDQEFHKINPIEFLGFAKGVAIFAIIIYHYFAWQVPSPWSLVLTFGGAGVHAFVILSGFGLALSNRQLTLAQFYQRRLLKILIPYYFFVTVVFILDNLLNLYPQYGWYAFLGHIAWYKMFDETIVGSFSYPLWFMSLIIQLYLIFPGLDAIRNRMKPKRFMGVGLLISLAYWTVLVYGGQTETRILNSNFISFLWEFVLGMGLAQQFKKDGVGFWQEPPFKALAIGLGCVVINGLMVFKLGAVGKMLNNIPAAIGFVALTIALFGFITTPWPKLGRWRGILSVQKRGRQWLNRIGRLSFELYLVHILALVLVDRLLAIGFGSAIPQNFLLQLLIALPLSWVLALGLSWLNQQFFRFFQLA